MGRRRSVEGIICGHDDRPYFALGMCRECYYMARGVNVGARGGFVARSVKVGARGGHESHNMSSSPEYLAWKNAKKRTTYEALPSYPLYGGRGIRMCDEWLNSFGAFYAHIGPRPGPEYSLDRIDVNGNYEPGNVRWATKSEQAYNRRPYERAHADTCLNGHDISVVGRDKGRHCLGCVAERRAAA